jgi:predicted ATPase/DNA-binding SARP family transcriptional activator
VCGNKIQSSTSDTNQADSRPPLSMQLFGSIEIHVHGVPIPRLRSRKGVWLLALLTLRNGKPVEREWLAGSLWPDSTEAQALAYLRHCLTELRYALGPEVERLQSPTRQALTLDLAGAEVDVLSFDAAIRQGDFAGLRRAVDIYRGPLLEDCTEPWAPQERGSRELSYIAALQRLADEALSRGDAQSAIVYSRRTIAVDPLQEGAQRTLIQGLASAGDYGAAVQAYRDLRLHLHRELNVDPDPLTTALYNRLRTETRQTARIDRNEGPSPPGLPPPRRLPRPITDLLGREEEVFDVAAVLRQRRLVTLTGTGGLGKTRLAIAVAEVLVDEHSHGAWFVELAGLTDPKMVIQSVATTLGVRDESGRSLFESIVSFLAPKVLLLVLDNCEHLLSACAQLAADLLERCSGARILATSRQALGITGEVSWPVPLLPVPDLANLPTEASDWPAHVSKVASVQLFVERAEAMQRAFALTAANALSVAQICTRLDGIPLAIELAAGHTKVLPIEQISLRLDDAFRLLTRGSRTALPRQQTLQATLDWSYELLTTRERVLLQRLSVFADGWTLEESEQVCAGATTTPVIEPAEVLDLLSSLVDKSMVQLGERGGRARYRLLETVRQYARDRLAGSGGTDAIRNRHRNIFLALAEAGPKLRGVEQGEWLQRLEQEHENLLAALEWSLSEAGAGTSLRFCGALSRFWVARGHLSEGREWCTRVLGKVEGRERATVLDGVGKLAIHQGDYASARAYYQESLAIYREIGDLGGVAQSLNGLGKAACNQDEYAAAQAYFQESLGINRELCDGESDADSHFGLGRVAEFQGNLATALEHYQQSLAMYRQIGDQGGAAYSLSGLGNTAFCRADYASAQVHYQESLGICRQIGDRGGIAYSVNGLGIVACALGEYLIAVGHYQESLGIYRQIGDRRGIAHLLDDLGRVDLAQADHASALGYCKESLAIFQEIGDRMGVASTLGTMGRVAFAQGDLGSARVYHGDSLAIERDIGTLFGVAESLEALSVLLAHVGKEDQAAIFGGAAEALRGEIGTPLSPAEGEALVTEVAKIRRALGERAFSIAWEQGRKMKLEAAIAMALEN